MKHLLTLSLCAAAAISVGLPSQSAQALDMPATTIPNGLGIQLKTSDVSVANEVLPLGVKFIRRGFYWKHMEKEKGVYDFSAYDELVAWAVENDVRIIGCFFSNNPIHENDKQGGIQTEAGRKGFAAWAAACAKYFKGKPIYWEIWNEPNVQTFWRKGKHNSVEFANEYSALVNEVVPAMIKEDPDVYVMAGSVSNYWKPVYKWTEQCFKNGVIQSGIKGWSVHPYGVKSPEEHATGGGGGHAKMRELMRKYNDGKEIDLVNSERGFSVKKTREGWSGGSLEKALEFQSWHVVRMYMIGQMTGVRATIWYQWKEGGDPFDLRNKDGSPRPGLKTMTVMAKTMTGYDFVECMKTKSPNDYILKFKTADNKQALVAWTAPPFKSAPDKAVEHSVDVEVPGVNKVTLVDILGKRGESAPVDGKLSLQLSGAPQYVLLNQ